MAECIEVVAGAFAALEDGEMTQPLRSVFVPPDANGLMAWMPAHHSGSAPVFGMKVLCLVPSNPSRGLDAHQGLVLVSDGDDRAAARAARCRSDHGDPHRGRLGSRDAAARARRRLDAGDRRHRRPGARTPRVDPDRAADRARPHRGPHAGACAGVRRRARRAVPVRDRGEPERRGRRPRRRHRRHRDEHARADPRARVAGGRDARQRGRRQPAHASRARHGDVVDSALFTDRRQSLENEAAEYHLALEEGLISAAHVRGELGELVTGKVRGPHLGRRSSRSSARSGLAVFDVAAAEHVVAKAHGRAAPGSRVEF